MTAVVTAAAAAAADGPAAATVAERLAAFATATARDGAPDAVRTSVRQRILDIAGIQIAALELPTSAAAARFALAQAGGGRPAGPDVAAGVGLGGHRRLPAPTAAFLNGVLAHSLDYDDTHLPSILHPSAAVVPAALAVAEVVDADGPRLLDAVAVGVEVVIRVGMAGYDRDRNTSVFFEHGQHATSICGTLGAAVAAALLLDAEEARVVDAIGVAASMASGIIEANRTGGTVKRLHCGWAAQAGVSAALLVREGFTGPPTAIEGRFGLLEAFLHGTGDVEGAMADLGSSWEVPGVFFKPYPANHFTHTTLDAAAALRAEGVRPEDVAHVRIGVAGPTVRTVGEPIERKRAPRTGYEAQFSAPFLFATGLLGGGGLGADLDDFSDAVATDPVRRDLMARIDVEADPRCDAIYPFQFPAVVTVRLVDGTEREVEVLANRGGSARPLTDDELALKFRSNAARTASAAAADRVAAAVGALGGDGSARALGDALADVTGAVPS